MGPVPVTETESVLWVLEPGKGSWGGQQSAPLSYPMVNWPACTTYKHRIEASPSSHVRHLPPVLEGLAQVLALRQHPLRHG